MTAHKHYTKEQIDYIREIAYKRTRKEITDMFNTKFNENRTVRSIGSQLSRRKIRTCMQGHETQFKKGNKSWNKGKRVCFPGSEKGWFEKGHTNTRFPIGAERVSEGFVEIKTEQPEKWEKKHLVIWKEYNGYIPEGHVVLFKNNDKLDCRIENLFMVKRTVMSSVAIRKLRHENPAVNTAAHKLAELELTIKEKTK